MMRPFLVPILVLMTVHAFAQSGLNFRSAASGDWEVASTWQVSNGGPFVPASTPPTVDDDFIQIRNGHTVTYSSSDLTADDVLVMSGGTLVVLGTTLNLGTGALYGLRVAGTCSLMVCTVNGPGSIGAEGIGLLRMNNCTLGPTSLVVNSGTIRVNSVNGTPALGIINNSGSIQVESGHFGQLSSNGGPCMFNNLVGGTVLIGEFATSDQTWCQVTNLQGGGFNKSPNTTHTVTLTNDFGGKSLTVGDASISVPTGTLLLDLPLNPHGGAILVSNGATLASTNSIEFTGWQVNNAGTISTPQFRFAGNLPQTLQFTGSISDLAIDNPAGVQMDGDQTVTGTLTMINGPLRLGPSNLFVENNAASAVVGGNATSWVVNNGSGRLHRQVNGSGYLFPIGTSSYTPITLSTTGPQDRYSAGVQNGVNTTYSAPGVASGSPITTDVVGRTWVVDETTPGGNTISATLQWNAAEELTLFGRSNCTVARYDGISWVNGGFGAALGTGPFSSTITGLSTIRELCVADADANLNGTTTSIPEVSDPMVRLFPNPASDHFVLSIPPDMIIEQVTMLDACGARSIPAWRTASGQPTLDIGYLTPGSYVVEIRTSSGEIHHARCLVIR